MNVVITGGTRGIGKGLALEFLKRGHKVYICGRHEQGLSDALSTLVAEFGQDHIAGSVCDVTSEQAVGKLWEDAVKTYGSVDIWINNAGRNNAKQRIYEMPLAEIDGTLRANLSGMIIGSVIAFRGMLQQGSGWIFNMEGFGSDGMIGLDQVPYGLSKYGLRYFTKALVKTAKDTPVKVGYLSPGIVTTEMAVPRKENRSEFFFENMRFLNVLSDHVETVTPWLVDRIIAAFEDGKNGIAIRWMGWPKALWRFVTSVFKRRRVIEEAMERLDRAGPG